MNRRLFLFASGSLSLSPFVPQNSVAETDAGKDVTRTLARRIVSAKPSDLPAPVRKEAARTLLNWVGCSVGGSRHETVGIAISALAPFSGPAQASILGRKERLDILHAALINGISSHVLDFDDTHSHNIIHPAGPVISAILALSEHRPVSGNDFVNALVLGVDVECRIGNSVYPKHYDAGWHITGTAGVFGAAAACGKLLALSELQMLWALACLPSYGCIRLIEHVVDMAFDVDSDAETITRVIQAFPDHQRGQARLILASILKGCISQRLVPRADGAGMVPAVEVMVSTGLVNTRIAWRAAGITCSGREMRSK